MNNLSAYLDFVLEVSPVGEQSYTIVARSTAGEVRQVAHFPLTVAELEHDLVKLENAILRSNDGLYATPGVHEQTVQSFGRLLFEFLLAGETRTLYYESLREAAHQDRGVRLKLSLHAPMLATLPWEFLYDARKRDFVCLDPHTPLVRYTELAQTPQPLAVEPPLQILAMIADPVDVYARLDVEGERRRVNQAVHSLVERGLVQITWLEGQTWRDLQRTMRTGETPWHIFHFVGHGGFDEQRNEGYIVMADEAQHAHRLYATQLARLLARQRTSLRLVLLNACEGARTGAQYLLSSTAATLINSGVPAVLAMQYAIADTVAIEFANTFYESLADNLPVDAAVAEARNAINFHNARSLAWAIPVLYMRSPDGQLFALTSSNHVVAPHQIYTPSTREVSTQSPAGPPMANVTEPVPVASQDDLDTLISAVEQQGRHLVALSEQQERIAAPAPILPPVVDEKADKVGQPSCRENQPLDIADVLQSYAQRHYSIIGFDWVTIPAGDFYMGSDPRLDIHCFEDELPQFRLSLPEFRIARLPVTNTQYKLFIDATGHRAPNHWTNGEITVGKEKHPVVNVSWRDATAFCEWAGVRLPTEAEWEKAARGPDRRVYPWGDAPPTHKRCNFDMEVGSTSVVGSYPAGTSPYGVLDMAGNVWEWTASVWLDSYENYVTQMASQTENNLRRVLRGGGFRDLEFVRCAARSWDLPTQRYRDLGFRVVAIDDAPAKAK